MFSKIRIGACQCQLRNNYKPSTGTLYSKQEVQLKRVFIIIRENTQGHMWYLVVLFWGFLPSCLFLVTNSTLWSLISQCYLYYHCVSQLFEGCCSAAGLWAEVWVWFLTWMAEKPLCLVLDSVLVCPSGWSQAQIRSLEVTSTSVDPLWSPDWFQQVSVLNWNCSSGWCLVEHVSKLPSCPQQY